MKLNIFKILALLSVVITGLESYAQSNNFYVENARRIDAYINGPLKQYSCEEGMIFPAKYKASKIKSDLTIMSFINSLFDKNTIKPDVEKALSKVRKKSMGLSESVNGLIESDNITILGKYLWVNIKLDFIDSNLVRSKVTMRTTTHGKCGSYVNLPDFKVIRDFLIKDSRMLFVLGYDDEVTSDTVYTENFASLAEKRKDYKFNIPGSGTEDWINEIFIKQYQSDKADVYNYTKPPKDFVRLVKDNKIAEVKDLLFSPSYVTSLNAMESLIYLSSINKVQLTSELNDRITQIKNASFIIMQQGAPDVLYTRKGYRELQTTDERVIKKYSSSL
jgi:hypothetical protein